MNTLNSIITYVRRIVKAPSNTTLSNNLIVDYINRFWINDVDGRMQLFDLKTKYKFETVPGRDSYNMPLYDVQSDEEIQEDISFYPVYQGFEPYCSVNGVPMPFYTQRQDFWNSYPNYLQSLPAAAIGNGSAGPYTINLPAFPAIPGHVDMAGIIATGLNVDPPVGVDAPGVSAFKSTIPTTSVNSNVLFTATGTNGQALVVADSGQFLSNNENYGLLMIPGKAPLGNTSAGNYSTTENTINYSTGVAVVNFSAPVESGTNIQAQCYFYSQGMPRSLLYYNNVITVRPPPDIPYVIELDAYLSPAAFLSTSAAIPFAYMSEYIARGAARKILSDTGDVEQFQFYEPMFREQEQLVWKRSQRQFTSTRTPSLFSQTGGWNGSQTGLGLGGW